MTGTPKHAPGPWYEDPFGLDIDAACSELRGGPGRPASGWTAVAIHYGEDDPGGAGDEHVAYCHPDNVRLIAAAPDMLAEIDKQIEWLRHLRAEIGDSIRPSLRVGIDQSIKYLGLVSAKARGETAP